MTPTPTFVCLLLLSVADIFGEAAPSDSPGFMVHGDDFTQAGATLTLTCYLTGPHGIVHTPTSYEWVKDGKVIRGQTGRSLTLYNVTTQDEGDYQCGPPGADFYRKEHYLRVFVPPQVRIKPSGPMVRGILGETLTLTCEVTQAIPDVPWDGYSWSHFSFCETQRPLSGKERTLNLGPLTREDGGQYVCQARNDQHIKKTTMTGNASVTVEVVYLENITLTPDLEVNEGGQMTLTCAVDSHPTALLTWTVDGQEVRHVTDNLDHYVIMSAACSDSNNYTCGASNTEMPGRERNATTRVHVHCKQEDAAQSDHQDSTLVVFVIVTAVLVLVGMLIGAALTIKFYDRIQNFHNQLKNTLIWKRLFEDDVPMKNWEKPEDRAEKFKSLYEKGKVYIFPQLPLHEEGTAASSDDDRGDESRPHIGHPEVEEGDAEFKVKDLLRFTLQNSKSANQEDLPSFVLHNTGLSKQENVILVVDRKIGVVVMVMKLIKSSGNLSSLQEAVTNLLQARDVVMRRLQGLVQLCDVTAVLSLPYLTPQQANDVKILNSHPDVELLSGLDRDHCRQWMEGLRREKASKLWSSSRQGRDDPDTVYKMAASSFLTLAGCGGPGESPHSPDAAQSWLLTPAQVEVRDSTARLLHIWGPPGSGKTTLLVHRARQWLAEGKALILGIGRESYSVILAQIEKAVRKGQTDEATRRLRICRTYQEVRNVVKELRGSFPSLEIYVVIDILRRDVDMFEKMFTAVTSEPTVYVLSTSRQNLRAIDADYLKKASELGWESLELPDCIRCTKDTVELLNLLRTDVYPPIPSCSLPRDPDIPAWRVVDHCLHPEHVKTVSRCDGCKTEMSQVLPSPEKGLCWNDWIALHTGNMHIRGDCSHLYKILKHLPITIAEEIDIYLYQEHTSVSSTSDATAFSVSEHVINGVNKAGQPAMHLLRTEDFRGLERESIILVHYDDRDNDPQQQSQADRDTRLKEHRVQWFNAVSRSKGQVILLLLTPSPARSLLPEPTFLKKH